MTKQWGRAEENMEDIHAGDFKVRKPKNEDLGMDQLGMLLRNHVELTRAEEPQESEDPDN